MVEFGAGNVTAEIDAALSAIGFDDDDSWIDAVREAEAPLPSGCIGPYELIEEIDRGGQAVVYKARQPGTNRVIAIKRLRAGAFASASMRRRFEREIEALARLDHPHIVTAFAMDSIDGVPILAMKWIDGVPITEWAKHGARRPIREILSLFIHVCDAVGHAHQRGVIHRDLKPSNILVDAASDPWVLDFGLAKLTSAADAEENARPQSRQFVGTMCYAAPEQLRGSQQAVDVRSDVYSLGAILYEALTGQRPFESADTPLATLDVLERSEPAAPGSINPEVGRDLHAVLLKALTRDQRQRYASVAALAADLRASIAGEPVTAVTPSAWRQLLRSLRRHRVAASFAGTVFALVAACAIIAIVFAGHLTEQRDVARVAGNAATEARGHAEREAAKSRAVNSFLQGMLASADPMNGGHESLTVVHVLDQASAQLDAGSITDPGVEAAVRLVLGVTYHSIGNYSSAESHLVQALEIVSALGHPDPAQHAAAMNELGHLRTSTGAFASAEHLLREAIERRRALPGDHELDIAVSLNNLAKVIFLTGRHAESEPLWRESLSIRERLLGREHPLVGTSLLNLGVTLHRLGDDAEAAAMIRESLEILRRTRGDDHIDVGFALRNLGLVQLRLGDSSTAEATLRRSLEIKRKAIGEGHPAVGFVHAALGRALLAQGRTGEARESFERALEIYEPVMAPEHPRIAEALLGLARTRMAEGALAPSTQSEGALMEARDLLLRVKAMQEAALPAEHPDRAETAAAFSELQALERGRAKP